VYYFFGPEEYRIKEAEKETIRRYLPPSQIKTNHTTLSAARSKLEDIMAELSVFPMLGENQAFTITDIQALGQKQIEKIIKLLTPPDPHRIVIMTSPAHKIPNKKTKLFGYLQANTAAVEFARLSRPSTEKRLRAMFSKNDITIDNEAMEMLTTLAAGDMGGMILEASKLIDYVGAKGKITPAEVAAVSSDYQGFKIYELTDYVARREVDRALNIVDFLVRAGESWSGLMYFMGEHFVDLYLTKNNKPLGSGRRNMAWKYKNQVNLFENEQLERIISLIAGADRDLRSNLRPERAIVEKLIIEIAAIGN